MSRMSEYPHGFMNGLSVRGIPLNMAHPGKVYWVNGSSVLAQGSVGPSDQNPGTYMKPLLTLDAAINMCASGDIIMIMPGYTQTIANATSIVPDVNGIAIIGLGEGNLRPIISFSATSSKIILSGANCFIHNIILKATIDSVVTGLQITGANNTVNIETQDTSASVEFANPISTTATADNLEINWVHKGFAAGDAMTRGIDMVGCQGAKVKIDFFGKASTSILDMRTTACDNVMVEGRFYNESVALTKNVTNNTTSTWSVRGFDAKAGQDFAGSDDTAVAYTSAGNTGALGTDGTTITDSATTVLGAIGANNADNAFASTSVVANKDGSVLERLEAIMDPAGAFNPLLGFRVLKTSNLADGSGTDNLFTVAGRCLITSLTGEVTTVIGGAATMKLRDVTNSVDLCAATTIDTDAVGTMYALTSISANILNGTGATPVVGSIPNITGAVQAGAVAYVGDSQANVTIAHVLDAADTGAVTWALYYWPLTATSSIVAAA